MPLRSRPPLGPARSESACFSPEQRAKRLTKCAAGIGGQAPCESFGSRPVGPVVKTHGIAFLPMRLKLRDDA